LKRAFQILSVIVFIMLIGGLAAATSQPEKKISLTEAIGLGLTHDPLIKIQKETSDESMGTSMSATGQFDVSAFLELTAGFIQKEISLREFYMELVKRRLLEELRENVSSDEALFNFFKGLTGRDPDDQEKADLKNFAGKDCREPSYNEVDYYKCLGNTAQAKRDALGIIPNATEDFPASLKVGVSKPFRNGIVLTPRIKLNVTTHQFRGKSRISAEGGSGDSETWTSDIGLDLHIPLGKGWGEDSTGAVEKAAQQSYQAALYTLHHTVSKRVYAVAQSYWNLVAAQEKFQLWRDSKDRVQQDIVKATELLIQGEEIPSSDVKRVSARAARVNASMLDAQKLMQEAVVNFSKEIGLTIDNIETAPKAADDFPSSSDPSTVVVLNRLIEDAVEKRMDYRASLSLRDSAKTLWKAAELDLKPKKDLEFSAYYQGYDKNASIISGSSGVLVESLTGPSVMLTFNMDLPFDNNTAKGELKKAHALFRKSNINVNDLKRVIGSNVVSAYHTLQDAADQVSLKSEAVQYYKETLGASIETFKMGGSTLIDALLTEEYLTDALLTLADAKLAYIKALSQLRFETGTLISYENNEYLVLKDALVTLPSEDKGEGLDSGKKMMAVNAGMSGKIIEIYVKPGSRVKKDDVLAKIRRSDLDSRMAGKKQEIAESEKWAAQEIKDLDEIPLPEESIEAEIASENEIPESPKESKKLKISPAPVTPPAAPPDLQTLRISLADTDLQIEALNKKLKKQEDMAQKGLMAQGAVAKIQKEIDVLLKNKFQKENSILRLSENEEAFEKLKQELAEKRKAVFKQRSDRFSAEIKALEKQAETGSSIVSPVNGQIADIKVNAGDIVSPDACLMTIERQ